MEHHKRRWSVIYEGDVGSAWEWCEIKLHTCSHVVVKNYLQKVYDCCKIILYLLLPSHFTFEINNVNRYSFHFLPLQIFSK